MFFVILFLAILTPNWWAPLHSSSSSLVGAYKVKHTTDPSFECSGCARTRLIGCFGGQCSYRCYRSCTNGTNVVIGKSVEVAITDSELIAELTRSPSTEAHRFVLEGQRRRRKRWIGVDSSA